MARKPAFEIKVDQQAGIVATVLRGFWTVETLASFGAGMAEAIARIAPRHPMFGLISDSTEFQIQAPEVSEGFVRMMKMGAELHRGPTAILVGTILNKLQAERLFTDPRIRIFSDAGDARRWIDDYRARDAEARTSGAVPR